jgi:hypothetical protein
MPRDGGIWVPAPFVDYRWIHNELVRKEDNLTTQEVIVLSSEKQLKALNYRNTIAKRSI